ncbi:tetraspanin-7b isoform X1 [Syngnathoides biaculeatus]|uniref:tetraspanin-7b isoform X1 n=1 Tax=Syngnathoides biaculeatus TaxID=300417 RepID=UPI002ADD961A|nr:tetraspanin-7b isoform X1 [Syngnathoides biaculeatus]
METLRGWGRDLNLSPQNCEADALTSHPAHLFSFKNTEFVVSTGVELCRIILGGVFNILMCKDFRDRRKLNCLCVQRVHIKRVVSPCPQYAMFLSLVFLAELVAGISGFVFRHEIKGTFYRTYTDAVLNYNADDEASRAVDDLQRRLRCCGVYNYTSWFGSVYYPSKGVPASCCVSATDCDPADLRNATVAPGKVYHQGCYELVTSFMETNMAIVAGVTFGIAFSQLIGMLLACCLSRIITANQYEMV